MVCPSNLLTPRGTAVLPAMFHSVPLLIRISGPLRPAAITRGVISARFELKGIGGKFTRPTVCILSGSTILMLSLPEFATIQGIAVRRERQRNGHLADFDRRKEGLLLRVVNLHAIESRYWRCTALARWIVDNIRKRLAGHTADRDWNDRPARLGSRLFS